MFEEVPAPTADERISQVAYRLHIDNAISGKMTLMELCKASRSTPADVIAALRLRFLSQHFSTINTAIIDVPELKYMRPMMIQHQTLFPEQIAKLWTQGVASELIVLLYRGFLDDKREQLLDDSVRPVLQYHAILHFWKTIDKETMEELEQDEDATVMLACEHARMLNLSMYMTT